MSDLDEYIPMIDAIIIASNPDEVSPKKIRKAIQELFAVDLDSKRKIVNELIVERYHEIQRQPKVLITKNELMKKDEALARALKRETTRIAPNAASKSSNGIPKKKRKKVENANSNSINVRKVLLSKPLQELLGAEELPRTQVVKQVWDYIKEHNLQNAKDRREILCDEKMKPVFGKKMTMFQLNKILVNHLFNKEDLLIKDEENENVDSPKKTDKKVRKSKSKSKNDSNKETDSEHENDADDDSEEEAEEEEESD
ncbi:hypothetical protein TPHA_0G01260 [Tetrapisispora phaffii CBS 4417]|uniref:Uncharacterized protein n=1 Tax=Tetrapisispora phaffii (strain ATCC 24235 / CBS 4417 / NBRC 1672 / NRRL Y-8282 / UCD 70-5) TaxID=1071381 RepID=G8BVN5_TETPH|nr:hypothetical protein TPHA_0G01260 [Tetrapisispora phaffii CBS 4417]CCE63963.1 hypothetical protein TPHA_0G01260 [Tetrapisispora phaffii CBS 4417]